MSKVVDFENTTEYPIIVETWQQSEYGSGLYNMKGITIMPHQKIKLSGVTGEWYINTMFEDYNLRTKWNAEFPHMLSLGKFSTFPDYQKNYSWMEYYQFNVEYIDGIMYFVKKS